MRGPRGLNSLQTFLENAFDALLRKLLGRSPGHSD
jgi:hypothetical protein